MIFLVAPSDQVYKNGAPAHSRCAILKPSIRHAGSGLGAYFARVTSVSHLNLLLLSGYFPPASGLPAIVTCKLTLRVASLLSQHGEARRIDAWSDLPPQRVITFAIPWNKEI